MRCWALGSLLLALAHHSSSSARRNSRRMLISEAPTASEYVNVREGRQGRQIQPLACVSKSGGEKGVCMFAWNCVEAGGQHLGTCIDRFYFGSCCKLGGNKPSSGGSEGGSDEEKGELAEDILDNEIPDDVLVPVKTTTSSTTTTTTTVTTTTTTRLPPTTPTTSTSTTTTTTTTTSSSTTTTTTTTSTTTTSTTTTTTSSPSTTTTTTTTTKRTTTNASPSPVSSSTTKSSLLVTVTEDITTTVTDESTFTTIQEELSTTDEASTVTEEVASTEDTTTLSPTEETTIGLDLLPPFSTFATDIVFPTETTTDVGEDLFSEDEYVTDSYNVDPDKETSTPSASQETSTSPIESVDDTTTDDSEKVTTTENVEDVTTVGNPEEASTEDDLEEATTSSDAEVTVVTEVVDEETTEDPVVIIERPEEIEFPQSSEDGCKDNWVAVHIGPNGQPNAVGGLGGCVAKPGQYFNCSDTVISEGVYNCTVVDGPSPPGPAPPEEEACRTLSDPLKIKECLDSFSTPTTTTTTEKVVTTPQQSEPVDEGNNKTTETPTRLQTGWPDLSTMPFREICGHRPWLNQTFRRSAQATPRGGRMIGGQRTTKEMQGLWGGQHNRRGKIVNGEDAKYGEWPWQVSLRQWRTATFLHKCGAALLSENWAITAAHCVESVNPDELLLRMGEFDLNDEEHEPFTFQDRKVQIVASHPKFDPKTFEYDLALLRFYEPVVFTPNIIPVCIPEDDEDLVGRDAWVTGWGRLYEDGPLPSKMQKVTLPIINNTECELMYEKAGFREHIPHIFICAGYREGGKDSCEGDSGGPMSVERTDGKYNLAGIISWGIGCAKRNQPGVMTRIAYFRDWINTIIKF